MLLLLDFLKKIKPAELHVAGEPALADLYTEGARASADIYGDPKKEVRAIDMN